MTKAVEILAKVSSIVDGKGLHTLADQIQQVMTEIAQRSKEVDVKDFSSLKQAIADCRNIASPLIRVADALDRQGLISFADALDEVIRAERLDEQDNTIQSILSAYQAIHKVAADKQTEPMWKSRSKKEKKQLLDEIGYSKPEFKMYRGSPIYPRLFEGFNTINLDRSYYQYHDFSYASFYG